MELAFLSSKNNSFILVSQIAVHCLVKDSLGLLVDAFLYLDGSFALTVFSNF